MMREASFAQSAPKIRLSALDPAGEKRPDSHVFWMPYSGTYECGLFMLLCGGKWYKGAWLPFEVLSCLVLSHLFWGYRLRYHTAQSALLTPTYFFI
jgi:hypothetical protein